MCVLAFFSVNSYEWIVKGEMLRGSWWWCSFPCNSWYFLDVNGLFASFTDCLRHPRRLLWRRRGTSGRAGEYRGKLFLQDKPIGPCHPHFLQQEWPFAAKFLLVFVKYCFFLTALKCAPSWGKNTGKRILARFLRPKRVDFDEFFPFKIGYFRRKRNGVITLCIDNQLVTLNDCVQRSVVQLVQ